MEQGPFRSARAGVALLEAAATRQQWRAISGTSSRGESTEGPCGSCGIVSEVNSSSA